ncbi:MAG: DnaJ family domain-containing protein [Burkholderiales bacterium]
MLTLDAIAERRIREAQERGEFDDLPGAGAPLEPEDNALVPEELRAAYRILKNSGFLPPELQVYSEIREVEQLLQRVADDGERARLMSRINFLLGRGATGRRHGKLRIDQEYFERLAERLEQRRKG